MNNNLFIAAAGSGKTTFLINEAIKRKSERVLILTYTEVNELEIKKTFIKKYKSIPPHVTIQTWFSFLIQHGVKPYQGTFNELLFDKKIRGMILNDGSLGIKFILKRFGNDIPVPFKEDSEFAKHYFTSSYKIYSDRLPKFVVKADDRTNGEVIERISRIYMHIFIDEVQDLAGYDLDIIKKLFASNSNIILVGDPRQVTYLTHHENKYAKYKEGKIKDFIENECKKDLKFTIDETMLNNSHRNNKEICFYSGKLYQKQFATVDPCQCEECRSYKIEHEGIFLVRPKDVEDYLQTFNPVQLRWNVIKKVNPEFPVFNFGESKGKSFDRVLIYPTNEMNNWVYENSTPLAFLTRAKFYVAITRARYSVAIISDYPTKVEINGIQLYTP